MKTNHRRGYKARSHTDNAMWHEARKDPFSGSAVSASIGNDFSNGRRGEAKAKRGAKKFLNSRIRFRQNAEAQRVVFMENGN